MLHEAPDERVGPRRRNGSESPRRRGTWQPSTKAGRGGCGCCSAISVTSSSLRMRCCFREVNPQCVSRLHGFDPVFETCDVDCEIVVLAVRFLSIVFRVEEVVQVVSSTHCLPVLSACRRVFCWTDLVASVKPDPSSWSLGVASVRACLQNICPCVHPGVDAMLLHQVFGFVRSGADLFLKFGAVSLLIGERGVAGDVVGVVSVDVLSRAFLGLLNVVCCLAFVGFLCLVLFVR